MKYYVGVDGGGTKTEVVVCDEKGNLIARRLGGSSNPNDIGREKMTRVIEELLEDALPVDCDCADIGLGISGLAASGEEEYLKEFIRKYQAFDKIAVRSDRDSCLDCAYDDEDGAIVIMGTGSVAFVRKNGKIEQIAGGGYLIDDSLSGFDLGREVLNALLEAEDGRGEKTVLTSLFEQTTGENIRQHLKIIYRKGKVYIASFSRLVFDGLEKGDAVAEGIVRRSVAAFEKILYAVYRLLAEGNCVITIFGGLTKKFEVLKNFLSKDIQSKCIFKYPKYPIAYGLLKEFVPKEERSAFAENLKRTYVEFVNNKTI